MKIRVLTTLVIVAGILFSGFAMVHINQNRPNMPYKAYYNGLTADAKQQVECLAQNIYFEAAHEPEQGKIAVAFVTINRVNSKFFPKTICDVVKQKARIENIGDKSVVCQFSWYCEDGPKAIYNSNILTNGVKPLYNEIRNLAVYVYANYEMMADPTNGALFYHADYVKPGWKNMQTTAVIGRHIFYNRKDM